MPWFNVDDGFHSHPKGRKAGLEAIGLWTIAGSYCMSYLTDGFVSEWVVKSWPKGPALAKKLVAVGLWIPTEKDGDKGFQFHDWELSQRSKIQVEADRRAAAARQDVARNPELRDAVKDRDGDRCRYCGLIVEWSNRRGSSGGTYDHVIPNGGTNLDNLVVCCRGCNAKKGRRTPEQAGMRLLPPKTDSNQIQNKAEESLPPHTNTQPSPSLVVNSGGGVTSVDAREARPHCARHPNENSNAACRDCARRREWDVAEEQRRKDDELATRRARREAIDACNLCDQNGKREVGNNACADCDHKEVS